MALVSPAARTAATAELVVAGMPRPPELRLVEALYGADPDDVLALVRALPDEVPAALVVGHNPTMQTLAERLLAPDQHEEPSLVVPPGFPTCALGVYRFDGVSSWLEVELGTATLVALLSPPY